MKYHKPDYDYLKSVEKLVSRQQIMDYIKGHKEWCDSTRIDLLEKKLLDLVFDPLLRTFVSSTISGMKEGYKKEQKKGKENLPTKKSKKRIKYKPLTVIGVLNRIELKTKQEVEEYIKSHEEWWNLDDLKNFNVEKVSPDLRSFFLLQIAELKKMLENRLCENIAKSNKLNLKCSIINSEDKVFDIASCIIQKNDLKIDEVRMWFKLQCTDDIYYQLFNHLLKFYFETPYDDYERRVWDYDIRNRYVAKIKIIKPKVENNSFYSFSVSDFCKGLGIDLQRFQNALFVVGLSSSNLEFSDKIINFKVQKFIDSFDIIMSEKSHQVFLMVATAYARKFVNNTPQQTYIPKEEKPKPIRIIYTPFGGQNGKKHH